MSDIWVTTPPEVAVLELFNTVALKPLFVIFLLGYVFFSLVVVRQVQLLTRTLGTALSPALKLVTIVNFMLSCSILVLVFLAF